MSSRPLTVFHMPHTRSSAVMMLVEELGVPHELKLMNLKRGENRQPEFLAVNPMGKVPCIRHGDTVVTEQVAIFLYLSDLFGLGRLAPALDDPARGTYLRWMVFYAAALEPAALERSAGLKDIVRSQSPYGTFEDVLAAIERMLTPGPYVLGDRFSAADILWGMALSWLTRFQLVPETPAIHAYVDRHMARPSAQVIGARDTAAAAAQEAAAAR